MRTYRVVRRKPVVRFIAEALERSGAEILEVADPSTAPFRFRIRTPAAETLTLICYAFLANRYRQRGRPPDEHRFQVKYGSDFTAYHRLHLPKRSDEVTLMFGAHLEEQLFVACDPAMHEWTRFSRSVEFKDEHIQATQACGWFGWHRDRSWVRRHAPPPMEDARTEVLVGFLPEWFVRYVNFERLATGLDPGERLLLVDRVLRVAREPMKASVHPLEEELGLRAHQILDMIAGAFRLKAAIRGSAAEHHLGRYLESLPGISRVTPIDKDGMPDFEVIYQNRTPVRIECKNVLARRTASGLARVDFQKTRASKADPCSRYYKASQFEILAACLHPITEKWEFKFVATKNLPAHSHCMGRLSSNVLIGGVGWYEQLEPLLEEGSFH